MGLFKSESILFGECMKLISVFFFLIFIVPVAQAEKRVSPKEKEFCVGNNGQPKPESHCVCYVGKTSCDDGIGTCAKERCEEWKCTSDKDCAPISAKCVESYCKI